MQKTKNIKVILCLLFIITILSVITFSSLAYFNFSKVFEGGGELPILHIDKSFINGDETSLKNIYYNGQIGQNLTVKLNTNGNNIGGYVRVKIAYAWSGSLSNITYNTSHELVNACSVDYDENIWQEKNGYIYLKNEMLKDSEIVLFENIIFDSLTEDYRGNKVDIYLICEIYQKTNLPENWEE